MAPRPSCTALRLPSSSLLAPAGHTKSPILPFLLPFTLRRYASQKNPQRLIKKKKEKKYFHREDLRKAQTYTLCEAMRYLRAFEVGRPPESVKYELAISISTIKNGPVIRNRIRLPHAVDTSERVAVFCATGSPAAKAARAAGAVLVGDEAVLEAARAGRIEFTRLLCVPDSLETLNRAGVGRILGPRGLMPSPKTGTVVGDVAKAMREMQGAAEYREKVGTVRLAIGQLGFTPEMMMANIKVLMRAIKAEAARYQDKLAKQVHEVVISTTNGPGFPLSGVFRSETDPPTKDLSVL